MIQKTRGLVLTHVRFGETSAIIHVFTQGFGMQSYMVNGVFGSRKRDKAQLLQPLNLLDMEVYHKPGKEIQRIKEFKLERPLRNIPFSQSRRAQAYLITEMLSRVLRNEHANAPLFSFLEDGIGFLDSDQPGMENFHLFFLFHLSRFMGFFPHNNQSPDFPVFDIQEGCFISAEPSHPYFLTPRDASIFMRLFEMPQHDLPLLAANQQERRIVLNALITLFEIHVQGSGHLRSPDVLGELFRL
jgi:DNA repair protein RecO (recombination protein O)